MNQLKKLFGANSNSIKELCLISEQGEILAFFSNYSINEGDKNRIATSIMASIALSTRAMNSLVNDSITSIILKGQISTAFIVFTKKNNYLYINTKTKNSQKILTNFEKIIENI